MKILFAIVSLLFTSGAWCQMVVSANSSKEAFPVVSSSHAAAIVYDSDSDSLVHKVAHLLQEDIEKVTGKKPGLHTDLPKSGNIILIGDGYRSKLIRQLIATKKLNLSRLQNGWEAYQVQVVNAPFKGIDKALVIVGSDRRGTAYGVLELSKQIGVSPWHWWADVPVKKQSTLYVKGGTLFSDAPKVKYRGIFINDEAPALSSWSREKFGGFNHLFYEKVFELLLRLKANYLWPAMWGSAFYDDDPLNKQTADSWGIVIGTSHHEPLMRAHDEWRRYGSGKWNYDSNKVRLQQFWREGMQRATNEKIVSIGMRGDGDEPMSTETATTLLERIVADQRAIIRETTGKPASETPQLWALYKEVQDYYDKGMRVPDDVTLLLCDDNWGNIRRLPKLTDKPRNGGYGIYYHFDYVGGPRNYKWLNTNNIARVWEQMHLAYEHNARQIWIVNVGDIKPMEFPTSFFLDYAWNPLQWNEDNLRTYHTQWAAQQFGARHSKEIGDILRKYSQYSSRRKPELLNAETYSLTSDNEWNRIVKEWNDLQRDAEKIAALLPVEYGDAFFQLVLHPVKAFANLHRMYMSVAQNKSHAAQNSGIANMYADEAKRLYKEDSLITRHYHSIAGGKWNGMMSQTHIGYTYWQQPEVNTMPEVKYIAQGETEAPLFDIELMSAENLIPSATKSPVFYEANGIISIEAEHWSRAMNSQNIRWKIIPDIGRTGSGITTFPVTAYATLKPGSPHVEYDFYSYDSGSVRLHLFFSPTLNFHNNNGLKYAVSIDGETPQIITLNADDNSVPVWESWVANNRILKVSDHKLTKPGKHTLKYWMISPGVVLQKGVIHFGGPEPNYLGPSETIKKKN